MSGSVFDCQRCGACCSGWRVPVTGSDLVRIDGVHKRALVVLYEEPEPDGEVGRMACTKRSNEDGPMRCVALVGKIGKRVSCVNYEDRPDVCRAFEAGTRPCLEARERSGMATKRSAS